MKSQKLSPFLSNSGKIYLVSPVPLSAITSNPRNTRFKSLPNLLKFLLYIVYITRANRAL